MQSRVLAERLRDELRTMAREVEFSTAPYADAPEPGSSSESLDSRVCSFPVIMTDPKRGRPTGAVFEVTVRRL